MHSSDEGSVKDGVTCAKKLMTQGSEVTGLQHNSANGASYVP